MAHTMQHWQVYRKWNELLFEEMYQAYKEGRSDTDPSKYWYEGEIGFFDYYGKSSTMNWSSKVNDLL